MDMASQLLWGTIFGAIGFGFFSYGKKQRATIPILSGIGLFVIPYFITNLYILLLAGVALMVLPYFVKI